jgi:hypothetical protein
LYEPCRYGGVAANRAFESGEAKRRSPHEQWQHTLAMLGGKPAEMRGRKCGGMLMRGVFSGLVVLLAISAAATGAQSQTAASAAAPAAVSPADQACDAQKLSTNDYDTCLQQAETKTDNALTALIKSIPTSAKVKTDVLGPEVAASAKSLWRKNFAALAPAFRADRNADCEDDSIAALGYGNGGLQARLACEINQTSAEIDKLKARYGLQ